MSRFPHLPETFILREMDEMENQGWEIALFPLIFQQQTVIHGGAIRWIGRAHRSPFFSLKILADSFFMAISKPGIVFSLFFQIIRGNLRHSRFLIRSLALMPKIIHFAGEMEREHIEHIHAHYATYPALAAWAIHRLTGIPYSVTVHAHDIFVEKPMLALKMKEASYIIAISRFNRDYLATCLGEWILDKIHVIHCGIRPEDYITEECRGAPDSPFTILHIGSLEPYKGQKYLLEAVRILRMKDIPLKVQIIGMGVERPVLERRIREYGLEDCVTLAGEKTQEEISELLPMADCYVQPSVVMPQGTMEGIPVALMEAMACSLPVVATGISGIPELIDNEETGLLLPPENPEALASAIAWVFENPKPSRAMGRRGREKVIRDFNLHKNVSDIGKLFATVSSCKTMTV